MGGWGRQFLAVTPSGTVLPCHAAASIPGLVFDNVRERSLGWIWRRSEAFNRFRGKSWMREPCRSCPRAEQDFGGCRCQAFLLTGDADEHRSGVQPLAASCDDARRSPTAGRARRCRTSSTGAINDASAWPSARANEKPGRSAGLRIRRASARLFLRHRDADLLGDEAEDRADDHRHDDRDERVGEVRRRHVAP